MKKDMEATFWLKDLRLLVGNEVNGPQKQMLHHPR